MKTAQKLRARLSENDLASTLEVIQLIEGVYDTHVKKAEKDPGSTAKVQLPAGKISQEPTKDHMKLGGASQRAALAAAQSGNHKDALTHIEAAIGHYNELSGTPSHALLPATVIPALKASKKALMSRSEDDAKTAAEEHEKAAEVFSNLKKPAYNRANHHLDWAFHHAT